MLIVAALNGTRSRLECPKVPLTAEDLATEAKRAVEAGAGLVHVHARKKDGLPAFDLFIEDVVKAIRGKVDVPISISTQRTRSISLGTVTAIFDVLRELPDLATVGVRAPEPDQPSHREEARQILEACEKAGVRPEPVAIGVDSLGDFETLYNDSLLSKAPYIVAELGPSDGRGSDRMAGTPHNVLRLADACRATFSRFDVVMSGQRRGEPDRPGRRGRRRAPRALRVPGRRHDAGRGRGHVERAARRDGRPPRRGRRAPPDGARRRARHAPLRRPAPPARVLGTPSDRSVSAV